MLDIRRPALDAADRPVSAQSLQALLKIDASGRSQVHRSVYTDPAIFDLEMKYIWERVWVYICHESQLKKPGDYVTGSLGRQPIFAIRDKQGDIGVFVNACSHRGAMLCRLSRGNARILACPYHGWTFSTDGNLIAPKEESTGAYPDSFDKQSLRLKRIPRVEFYKGFIFACLDADIEPLDEYLGDAKCFIDMLADQGPSLEILDCVCSYVYKGNWKLQAENGVDGYHPSTVHWNFIATQKHRAKTDAAGDKVIGMNPMTAAGGYFDFGHGHTMIWGDWTNPEDRFNYSRHGEFAERMGKLRADWVVGRLRNLLLYPSVFLMDQQSSQIRVIQPLAVDRTKVTIFGVAPSGETPAERTQRIRYYEDFFNASGMATPDDLSEFNASQMGFQGRALGESDLSRGAKRRITGPNQYAKDLGLNPRSSGARIDDEGIYLGQFEYWLELLTRGLARDEHA
jgi:benzoate/toluate 1,2-dioxygenase alpha subunit